MPLFGGRSTTFLDFGAYSEAGNRNILRTTFISKNFSYLELAFLHLFLFLNSLQNV